MVVDNMQKYLKNTLEEIKKKRVFVNTLGESKKINVVGFSDFFINDSVNVSYLFSSQIINLNEQSVYLSLYENNTNFNEVPLNSKTHLFGNKIHIKGDFVITPELACNIFVIFYNDKKRLVTKSFKVKNGQYKQSLDCPEKASSYRIAIKLEGSGDFQNNSILIDQTVEQSNSIINAQTEDIASTSVTSKRKKITEFKSKLKNLKYNRKSRENDLVIASILDEFSYECLRYDCNLIRLSKENWKEDLENNKPDFLLVESCWQGNNGNWSYEVANLHINEHRVALKQLTDYCRKNEIKTVFWDKEGLENFDFFKEASKYFDYIFTADENNIDNFKNFTGNEKIHTLAFAAQPQIHNPIYKNKSYLGNIAFAGSYYNNKHDLRKKDIDTLVGTATKYGVDVFDRYFNVDPQKVPNNQWPDNYKANIVGSLNYNEMVEAYKNYDIFLNVNSVQNSKYMFARRVFELLASRTMVVSGPSRGVEEIFEGLVPIASSEKEAENLLKIYMKNPVMREKISKMGARLVHQNHTYKNRLQEICDIVGVEKQLIKVPKVTIVTSTQRNEFMMNLYENIKHQAYSNFEVIVVLNKNDMDKNKWEKQFSQLEQQVKVIQLDEKISLGHCLNEAISMSSGEVIAKFDDDDYYAPNYLTDMIISMDYSNADIVGKSAHYVYLEKTNMLIVKTMGSGAESYTDFVSGATLVFTKQMFDKLGGFADRSRGEDSDLLRRAKENGFLIYSNDTYNFCLFRRKDTSSHTWQVDEEELLRNAASHSFTLDYKTPITF